MLAVAATALVVRVVAAIGMAIGVPGLVQPDEATYLELAEAVASGGGAASFDASWGPELLKTTGTFTWPLIALFEVLPAWRMCGQIVAAVAGAALAGLVAVLAGHALPARWALAVGGLAALMPSQVFWSSLVLRESMVWATLALVALGFAQLQRRTTAAGAAGAFAMVVAGLIGLAHLRQQTVVIAAWAAFLAAILLLDRRRLVAFAVAGTALLAPVTVGLGVAGFELVERTAGDTGRVRANLAAGADSSIIDDERIITTTTTPIGPVGSDGSATTSTSTTSTTAPGEIVTSSGQVYEVEETAGANLRHAPKGTVASLLRPFPWESPTGVGARFAQAENMVWYLLYALAAIGLWAMRRCWRPLAFPVLFAIGMTGVNAILQGNLGTAFRHRGQIFWVLALLAAGGAKAVADRRQTRRSQA